MDQSSWHKQMKPSTEWHCVSLETTIKFEHLSHFCFSSLQLTVLLKLRFVRWHCQKENTQHVWLYNSHHVSSKVFHFFIGCLFKPPLKSSWNRSSFCFLVTRDCRYHWAGNYLLGFCVNAFVGKKQNKTKQMLVWRLAELNMVWSIGATKERRSKQYYAIIVADHDISVVQKAGTVRYLCTWKPSFTAGAVVFTSCNI